MSKSSPPAGPRNELHRLAKEQAALRRVATLVASGAPSAEVFSAVAREVAQVLNLPAVGVFRYDSDGLMTVIATSSDRPYVFQPGTRWPVDGQTTVAQVQQTGRPARVEDYTDVPGALAGRARDEGLNATAGAPIIVDGSVWGAIAAASPDAPLPDQVEDRLAEFTEMVATAIANSQAHEEIAQLADEHAALRRVATLVAAGAPPAEVFEAVSAEAAALIGADGSAVTRYEEDGTVTAVSGWTTEGGYNYVGRRYELEGTVSGQIFETGRPGRVDSYAQAPGAAPEAAREMGWHSSVGAPISVDGRLWGVLAVVSKGEQPLPPNTEQRLTEFAGLFATAIANSEAHEQLAQLADEQAALRRVATLVAEGATPQRVFDVVRHEVARMFNTPVSMLMRYDDANGTATLVTTAEGFLGPVGRSWPVEGDSSATAQVCRTGLPARADYTRPTQGPIAAAARAAGGRSAVGVPVVVQGAVWGVVTVGTRGAEPLPADIEGRLAKFTELLATAIARSDAHEQLTLLADEQAALRRVATLVAEGATPQRVFDAVRGEVARMFNAPLSGVLRYDGNGTVTQLAASEDNLGPVERSWTVEGDSAVARVCRTGLPARADYTRPTQGSIAATARSEGVLSAVGVPVVVDGSLWGVMAVGTREAEPLPADLEDRVGKFTQLLATAIANAESRGELAASEARAHELAEEQAALRRVATLVAEGATPHRVFDGVRQEVARMFRAPLSVLLRYDAPGTATVLATSDGYLGPIGRSWPVEGDISAIAQVCRTGLPARADYTMSVQGPIATAARAARARSAVAVPVVVDGTFWGVMAVGSREIEPLPNDFEGRLVKFTELLATALANAESSAELAASRQRIVAAADEARRRIERDLHDGIQQRLVSLGLELRAVQAAVSPQHGELEGGLSRISEGLARASDELREIARGIHPAVLSEGGLKPALSMLSRRSAVPVQLHLHADRRLPDRVEVAAYYVVSEALTNATKHAQASVVNVELDIHDSILQLAICDDGVGGADSSQGSGLIGLSDRVEALGGTLEVSSPPAGGTTLKIEIPLRDRSCDASPGSQAISEANTM